MHGLRIKAFLTAARQRNSEAIRRTVEGWPRASFRITSPPEFSDDAGCMRDEEFDLVLLHPTHHGGAGNGPDSFPVGRFRPEGHIETE